MLDLDKIKMYYENKLWTLRMVRKAVEKGVISKLDYEIITGEQYE